MSLLDVNVGLGRFARPAGGAFDDADALQAELARLGIGEALVYHALASEGDMVMGNRLLLEALKGHENLHPCWVMAPPYLDDVPPPAQWVADAKAKGVRAARLYPRYGLYPLEDWCVGELFRALEGADMPVLLDFGPRHWSQNVVPWGQIKALSETYPGLPIVVLGATVGDARAVDGLLRHSVNVYVEFSAFMPPDLLEGAAGRFADRLLFGTGLPKRAGECVVGQALLGASPKCLQQVGGDNARRLLGLDVPKSSRAPLAPEAVRSEVPVIDVHGHIGSWERTTTPTKGPAAFVRSMDRCGIAKLVFSSFAAIHGETRAGNRETAAAVREFPERLYGYCVVNPNDPDGSQQDLETYLTGESNFVGLKLHCNLHWAQLHDPGYMRGLAFANEHRLPVLVHGGGRDDWDTVCAQYPRASFIMAHACAWDGHDPEGRALYERVHTTPNLYVDLSGSAAHRGALRALIELVGADKILYGSDFPMFDLAWELTRVTLSDIAPEEKWLICGDNARRIFRRIRP